MLLIFFSCPFKMNLHHKKAIISHNHYFHFLKGEEEEVNPNETNYQRKVFVLKIEGNQFHNSSG